ncbi:mandelate racemase/muconate lactonizing enzyme family protein [Pseudokineococcus sp. 5B2Z-1]|uniref:mandelate racemase/muconate lactonizing enzyme family protein n=1 Tax=Pseudokineococcus sp. 5B2Z-1 TaxID=3132744 RepID=UPI0030B5D8C5
MKITGYRSLVTQHDWGRPVGDVNGHISGTATQTDVLVLTTDSGLEGVGVGAHPDIERVFPGIDGEDPRGVVALYDRMLARVFKLGHAGSVFGTLGAIDMALWDLKAKAAEEPLWRLLGARDRHVPGYASALEIALTDEELVRVYGAFADRGFGAAKLKGGRWFEHDLRRLRLLEEVFSTTSSAPGLMLDANESWHRSQAVRYVSRLEEHVDLVWVEEPVRRWDAAGMAAVRAGIRAGVASGENLTGLEQLRPLLDADALDVVQPGASWGITHLLRVSALAHAHDLPVSPIGFTPVIAPAAASLPNLLAVEVQDLKPATGMSIDQEFVDGGIVLGDEPGNGISVDEALLRDLGAGRGWAEVAGPHVRPPRAGLRLVPEADGGALRTAVS